MKRVDGRAYDELRPIKITTGHQSFAEGSAVIELGKTRVLCSVSVDERVPNFLKGSGTGWITAEYAMLPRATVTRTQRDSSVGRVTGRNQEIQRLIGRSLRAVADLSEAPAPMTAAPVDAPVGALARPAPAPVPIQKRLERTVSPWLPHIVGVWLLGVLLLAAWTLLKAVRSGRPGWLILGAVLVGLGFNIKMLQAFMPLPAFYALYFFGAKHPWWKRLLHLGLATVVLVVV